MSEAGQGGLDAAAIRSLVGSAASACRATGRDDLISRLEVANTRVARPVTVVCVVGEFKQGKSSLVNGLVGRSVCPVDDDLATAAVTVVRHSRDPLVVVHRRDGNEAVSEKIDPSRLREFVTEAGNPDNERNVDRVEVGFPSELLARGIAVVDTPGMGGLGAGHAAATIAFLPFADALLFVSDASAELSAPEVEFLRRAQESCPTILFALTKTDLYPEWRRILELNRSHLSAEGVAADVFPVSLPVRTAGLRRKDAALDAESGYPGLIEALEHRVVAPAKTRAAERAIVEVASIAEQLLDADRRELDVLTSEDPAAALAPLEATKARIDHLRGPAARWGQVLSDRVSDLTGSVNHRFRATMRTIGRAADDALEEAGSAAEWEAVVRDVQSKVADSVAAAFEDIDRALRAMALDIATLVQNDEALDLSGVRIDLHVLDVRGLWSDRPQTGGGKLSGGFSTGMAAIGGLSSGTMMLGAMSRVLPAAAAGVLALNPIVVGVGLVLGGQRVVDSRKRAIATRRQHTRAGIRQFLDDVQFEMGNQLSDAIRVASRSLRDEFTARVSELHETLAATMRSLQETAKADAATRAQRQAFLTERIGALESLVAAAGAARPAGSGG